MKIIKITFLSDAKQILIYVFVFVLIIRLTKRKFENIEIKVQEYINFNNVWSLGI